MVIFQEPLQWPTQQPRTKNPQRAPYGNHSLTRGTNELTNELRLLGAKECIITSDLRQKKDNMGPWANQRVDETGIAVYFKLKGEPKTMACDKWDRIEHNIWALKLSISSIRALARHGGSEFLDGLFTGFKALPGPTDIAPSKRYFDHINDIEHLKYKFRDLAKELHKDNPETGDEEEFMNMQNQYKQRKENLR